MEFCSHGILVCGSGHGVTMAANRYKHIRGGQLQNCERCTNGPKHNDMNVMCLGPDFVDSKKYGKW